MTVYAILRFALLFCLYVCLSLSALLSLSVAISLSLSPPQILPPDLPLSHSLSIPHFSLFFSSIIFLLVLSFNFSLPITPRVSPPHVNPSPLFTRLFARPPDTQVVVPLPEILAIFLRFSRCFRGYPAERRRLPILHG